jgi:hypothetical protein
MLEVMAGFPADVLAVRGSGRISADDYRKTLVPEVLRHVERHRSLRLLLWLGTAVEGMTPGAMWEDTKLGLRHWGDFGRIAVVTDIDWIGNAVRLFAPLFHHPVRLFPNRELDEAKRWIEEAPS